MQFLSEFFTNQVLWISVLGWAAAQGIKVVIDLIKYRKFDAERLVGTGGMPSSHAAFVTSMATGVGITSGFDSVLFALAFVFALVVMYDATGIRRAAGNHAKIINEMMDLMNETDRPLEERLKELLGHTPIEVGAGALLGIGLTWVVMK